MFGPGALMLPQYERTIFSPVKLQLGAAEKRVLDLEVAAQQVKIVRLVDLRPADERIDAMRARNDELQTC